MTFLAVDYLTILAVFAAGWFYLDLRAAYGLPWWVTAAFFVLGAIVMGGVQHRLAAIAHEASHYTLLRNRVVNDLVGDWLCLFPLMSSVQLYRLNHMGHHQFVNDETFDPDYRNMERFWNGTLPKGRWGFLAHTYLRPLFAPLSVIRYGTDYVLNNVFAAVDSFYLRKIGIVPPASTRLKPGPVLAVAWLILTDIGMIVAERAGRLDLVLASAAVGILVAVVGAFVLPDRWVYVSPFKEPYPVRVASAMRLTFLIGGLLTLNTLRALTEGRSTALFFGLWVAPLLTTFMYYMLLREIYQHGNTDKDRITNTRVFRVDPFTRWAVFVHGQDLHTPHHMYPAIPHYALQEAHETLKRLSDDYRARVVEVEGTLFHGDSKLPTILDVVAVKD
jgi:fatty acid desaturase